MKSMEISPLSLSWDFRSTLEENDWLIPGAGEIWIVLKDGTVFLDGAWPQKEKAADPLFDASHVKDTFVAEYQDYLVFDEPLDLTQVDYVQYGEYKFPVEVG